VRNLIFVSPAGDDSVSGFSLVESDVPIPNVPEFWPVSLGSREPYYPHLQVTLSEFDVLHEDNWQMFTHKPDGKPRHRRNFQIEGIAKLREGTSIRVLDQGGKLIEEVSVKIECRAAIEQPRSQVILLESGLFVGAWLPFEGIDNFINRLYEAKSRPELTLSIELNLPHVFCTDSVFADDGTLELAVLADPKRTAQLCGENPDWTNRHVLTRRSGNSDVSICFRDAFR